MKYRTLLLAAALMSSLGGCTSKIESSRLDYDDNGVAYKHGSTDPFTGEVHFGENDSSPFIATALVELTRNEWIPQSPNLSPRISLSYSCLSSFKNGVPEGFTQCDQDEGKAEFSFTLHDRRLDGEGILYNTEGDKIFVTHWKSGAYDGIQKVYSLDGSNVVHEWSVEDGHKLGKEYWAYNNGDDLAEGKWSDDGKFTGTMFLSGPLAVYTLKDGVKDGDFKQLDTKDPNLKQVAVEGGYSNGQRDGTWTYHGQVPSDEFIESSRSTGLPQLLAIPQEATTTVTWKQGTLSGPVKIYDKDQHVLLAFTIADGEIAAPIVRTDPDSGKTFTITDATILAALNYQSDGENPYLIAAGQKAIDAITQERNARTARIAYVLDPMHNPDPTQTAATQAPATSQPPSASPAPSTSGLAVSGTQTPDHVAATGSAPAQAAQASESAAATPAMATQSAAATPAPAGPPSLCMSGEYTLWTGTKGPKTFSLCASNSLSPTTGYMQYRAGTAGSIQFKYPATLENPHGIFSYSEGAHSAEIDFSNGGYSYSINEQASGSETDINVTLPSGKASTIVLDKASDTIGQNSTSDLFKKLGLSQ